MSGRAQRAFRYLTLLGVAGCTSVGPDAVGTAPSGPRQLFRIPVMYTGHIRPAIDERRVVIAPEAPNLWVVAYDRLTGGELWRSPRPAGTPRSLSIHDGRVLFAARYAVALSAESGAELWRVELQESASLCMNAAAGNSFFVGTEGEVLAINIEDGTERWRSAVAVEWEFRTITRGVSVSGDTVFATIERFLTINGERSQAYIVALDRNSGAVLWTHVEGDGQAWNFAVSDVLVTDEYVIFGDTGANTFVAIERATGAPVWRTPGYPGFFGSFAPPTRAGDTLFASSGDSYIRALDVHTGRVLWESGEEGSLFSQMVCGSVLLAMNTRVNAYDRQSGRLLQRNLGNEDAPLNSRLTRYRNEVYVFGAKSGYGFSCGDN